jgi:predicted homoserine dehydrogenase-like protein
LADIKHHIDKQLTKLIDRANAERKRVDANPNLTAAQKAKLDSDLNKLVTDATTARREVDAATNRAGLEAARPALQAVKADLQQLRKDMKSIPGAHRSAAPTAPGPSTS